MEMPTNKWGFTLVERGKFEYDCEDNKSRLDSRVEACSMLKLRLGYRPCPAREPRLDHPPVAIHFGCGSDRFMGTSLPVALGSSYGRKALIFWVPGY
jgi:hypothetical protein